MNCADCVETNDKGMGKYTEIWNKELSFIRKSIELESGKSSKKLESADFEVVGNRKSSGYGFRLDIVDGKVPVKSGSAVARDLKEVLDGDSGFRSLAKGKEIVIRMGKDCELEVEVK